MVNLGERLSEDEVQELLETADLDDDGYVNYEGQSYSMLSVGLLPYYHHPVDPLPPSSRFLTYPLAPSLPESPIALHSPLPIARLLEPYTHTIVFLFSFVCSW